MSVQAIQQLSTPVVPTTSTSMPKRGEGVRCEKNTSVDVQASFGGAWCSPPHQNESSGPKQKSALLAKVLSELSSSCLIYLIPRVRFQCRVGVAENSAENSDVFRRKCWSHREIISQQRRVSQLFVSASVLGVPSVLRSYAINPSLLRR